MIINRTEQPHIMYGVPVAGHSGGAMQFITDAGTHPRTIG